jgi:hypothetical protein
LGGKGGGVRAMNGYGAHGAAPDVRHGRRAAPGTHHDL